MHNTSTTVHVMSLNRQAEILQVEICTSIYRILSSLPEGSQLTLANALLTYINLCLSGTIPQKKPTIW